MTGCLPVPKQLLLELRLMVCIGLVSSGSRTNGGYQHILINLLWITLPCLEFVIFSGSILYSNVERDAFLKLSRTLIFLAVDK